MLPAFHSASARSPPIFADTATAVTIDVRRTACVDFLAQCGNADFDSINRPYLQHPRPLEPTVLALHQLRYPEIPNCTNSALIHHNASCKSHQPHVNNDPSAS